MSNAGEPVDQSKHNTDGDAAIVPARLAALENNFRHLRAVNDPKWESPHWIAIIVVVVGLSSLKFRAQCPRILELATVQWQSVLPSPCSPLDWQCLFLAWGPPIRHNSHYRYQSYHHKIIIINNNSQLPMHHSPPLCQNKYLFSKQ
jgi:hypothetical protein